MVYTGTTPYSSPVDGVENPPLGRSLKQPPGTPATKTVKGKVDMMVD
jgi:hypothetical protein